LGRLYRRSPDAPIHPGPRLKQFGSDSFRSFPGVPAYGVGVSDRRVSSSPSWSSPTLFFRLPWRCSSPSRATQREAALSLGATRWESTWKVVVALRPPRAIFGSIFLALAPRPSVKTIAVTMVIGKYPPSISASLFSPGYSNRRGYRPTNSTESHRRTPYAISLIELGLVLFLSHLHPQRPRPPADRGHLRSAASGNGGTHEPSSPLGANFVSGFMLTMNRPCALWSPFSVLFFHPSAYLVYQRRNFPSVGTSSPSCPPPVGRIRRRPWPTPSSAAPRCSCLASLFRCSHRIFSAAIYLAEFSGGTTRLRRPLLAADLLNGVPSHRQSVFFAYSLVVHPFRAILHARRRIRSLGPDDDSHHPP